MWKIHRYYVFEVAINSVVAFVLLFGIFLVSLVSKGIRRALGGDLMDAAKITFFWTLDTFPHLLTISFLIATVMTFSRASQDREITALRSAGISPRVPMTAALLVGMLVSVAGSFCLHYVIPTAHFKKYRVVAEAVRNAFRNLNLSGDRISIPNGGVVITYVYRANGRFHDCTVYFSKDRIGAGDLRLSPITKVEEIWIPVERNSETIDIHLQGVRNPLTDDYLESLVVQLPLRSVTERYRRDEGDLDLRSDELLAEVYRGVHPAPDKAQYTILQRTCFGLLPVLLAPLGFCIGVFNRDRGRMAGIMVALVPLGVIYLSDMLGEKLQRTTGIPWCACLPMAALVILGVPFCWSLLRQ